MRVDFGEDVKSFSPCLAGIVESAQIAQDCSEVVEGFGVLVVLVLCPVQSGGSLQGADGVVALAFRTVNPCYEPQCPGLAGRRADLVIDFQALMKVGYGLIELSRAEQGNAKMCQGEAFRTCPTWSVGSCAGHGE